MRRAKEKYTGRGGDFCGYNDRTSVRWRIALLSDEDRQWAEQLTSTIPIADIESYNLDGMPLGEHAADGGP